MRRTGPSRRSAARLGTDRARRGGGGDPARGRQHRARHPARLDRARAAIRATTRCCPSAAPARCWRPRSPRSSACARSWCRPIPASSRPSGCSRRITCGSQGVTRRMALDADDAGRDAARGVRALPRARRSAEFRGLGLDGRAGVSRWTAEMRFVGQAFEIPVPSRARRRLARPAGGGPGGALHRRASADLLPRRRAGAEGRDRRPALRRAAAAGGAARDSANGPPGWRGQPSAAVDDRRPHRCRARLGGCGGAGRRARSSPAPALIEGYTSTLWVPPGWQAARDERRQHHHAEGWHDDDASIRSNTPSSASR